MFIMISQKLKFIKVWKKNYFILIQNMILKAKNIFTNMILGLKRYLNWNKSNKNYSMKKTILSLLIIIFVSNLSFAQEPTLTKKQMYKDFDQLVKIIEDCNVQLPVRKAVTGIDNLKEIKKLRKGIDTVTNFDGFNKLLNRAIGLVLDGHTRQDFSFYPEFENLEGIDTV